MAAPADRARRPNLSGHLARAQRRHLGQPEERLVARELDAAFLMGPISRPEIVNLPLSSYPLSGWPPAARIGRQGPDAGRPGPGADHHVSPPFAPLYGLGSAFPRHQRPPPHPQQLVLGHHRSHGRRRNRRVRPAHRHRPAGIAARRAVPSGIGGPAARPLLHSVVSRRIRSFLAHAICDLAVTVAKESMPHANS